MKCSNLNRNRSIYSVSDRLKWKMVQHFFPQRIRVKSISYRFVFNNNLCFATPKTNISSFIYKSHRMTQSRTGNEMRINRFFCHVKEYFTTAVPIPQPITNRFYLCYYLFSFRLFRFAAIWWCETMCVRCVYFFEHIEMAIYSFCRRHFRWLRYHRVCYCCNCLETSSKFTISIYHCVYLCA